MKGAETRRRILLEGAKIVHLKGYHATGLQEVLRAADVPKGSFYFYFKSKHEFGLALIDFYTENIIAHGMGFLGQRELSPMERLKLQISWVLHQSIKLGYRGGCPIGNLSQELADTDEAFRAKLDGAFKQLTHLHSLFLREAQEVGEIGADLDIEEIAALVFNCYQGALIQMKVTKSSDSIKRIEETFFKLLSNFQVSGR